jgi:hypothetical protein
MKERKSRSIPCVKGWMIVFQEVEGSTDFPQPDKMKLALKNLQPEKYCFQLEAGKDKERLHYQISIVLNDPLTGRQLREKLKSTLRIFWYAGCCTTQPSHSIKDADIYCSKSETRVSGPYYYPVDRYFGQDLIAPSNYHPWQRQILAIAKWRRIDPRSINVIVDPGGNSGKSEISKYMSYHMGAIVIPLGLTSAQVKAALCGTKPSKNYIVDLPRNNKDMVKLFDTVEELKKGHVVSAFYGKFSNLYIHRPNIFMFTNRFPDIRLMSIDMWRIWTINEEKKLEPHCAYKLKAEQDFKRWQALVKHNANVRVSPTPQTGENPNDFQGSMYFEHDGLDS